MNVKARLDVWLYQSNLVHLCLPMQHYLWHSWDMMLRDEVARIWINDKQKTFHGAFSWHQWFFSLEAGDLFNQQHIYLSVWTFCEIDFPQKSAGFDLPSGSRQASSTLSQIRFLERSDQALCSGRHKRLYPEPCQLDQPANMINLDRRKKWLCVGMNGEFNALTKSINSSEVFKRFMGWCGLVLSCTGSCSEKILIWMKSLPGKVKSKVGCWLLKSHNLR